eukprot:SAG31_NODE_27638_length_422_cov_2.442724_2_plen_95_part_01
MDAEPRFWEPAWRDRPGFSGGALLRRRRRPAATQQVYDGKVALWLRFNREGDGLRPYCETEVTVDKFELFAGWLLGDHSRGIAGQSKDKDLNGFR